MNGPTAQPTDCGVRHFSKAELEIRYRVQPKHYLIGIGTGKDGNANALVPPYGGLLYNSCAGPFGVLFWLGNFRSPDFPPILKEVPLRRVLNQRVRRIAVSATDTYSKSSPVVGKAHCGEDNHLCDYNIDRHYTIHQHWSLVLRRMGRTK